MYCFEFDTEDLMWCVVDCDTGALIATFIERDEAVRYCALLNDEG